MIFYVIFYLVSLECCRNRPSDGSSRIGTASYNPYPGPEAARSDLQKTRFVNYH